MEIYFNKYKNRKPFSAQALPCTKAHIDATPNLSEDHTMGVIVGRYPVQYEAFDNKVASGNIN